jgi:hypothetical protein
MATEDELTAGKPIKKEPVAMLRLMHKCFLDGVAADRLNRLGALQRATDVLGENQ